MKIVYLILFTITTLNFKVFASSNNFPISGQERVEQEMGSIIGNNGITINPKLSTKQETKQSQDVPQALIVPYSAESKAPKNLSSNSKVQSLWKSAIFNLSDFPLEYMNEGDLTIITGWYTPQNGSGESQIIAKIIVDKNADPKLDIKVFSKSFGDKKTVLDLKKSQELIKKITLKAVEKPASH
jgi:hypothetical protein